MKLIPLFVFVFTGLGLAQGPPPERPEHGRQRPIADALKRKFDHLTDEDRQRIRRVMEKVWSNAEVREAREAAAEAAKKYRDTLHKVAVEVDPTIKPLLDKISTDLGGHLGPPRPFPLHPKGEGRPYTPDGEKGRPHPPDGERGRPRPGDFLPRALGLGPEQMGQMTEDQRGQFRQAMEKISQLPAIIAARQALESGPPEGRREAFQKFRMTLREALEKEIPELAKVLAALRKDEDDGGRSAPPPPGPGGPEHRPSPQ